MADILVVDDEPAVRELIATILRLQGHRVTEARNGIEALEQVEADAERLPDLIVLDIAMPEMDGWHVLEELYRRGLRRKTRVVVVTGTMDPRQPPGTGAETPILGKPFNTDALLTAVESALSREADDLYEGRERSRELARLLADIDETLRT